MASVKKAQVIITADASVAKKVMDELQQRATQAANKMKQLAAAGKQNSKEFKDAKKDFDAYNSALRENVKDTKRVEEVMKNLAGTANRDLKRALQAGKRELDKMSARDPNRAKLVNDLKKIQTQIDANTGAIKKQQSAWGSLGTTMKNLVAYAGIFAGFNKLKSMVEGVFQANLKLSDSLANIRKVSGLSGEAINDLYRNIAKIDSRNTIETLNQLAYTGAKLGIGQNYGVAGLTGFVKAAEQVQMALGEDMGEKALPDLSKMVEVMGLIPKYGVEQSMQKAASAIFQLGATSTATGTNIVEFSKRLYGLANVSRISTQDLLALGSASDAMGLMPEVSATAFNKLFTAIQRQHNLIESSLGMTKGTIKKAFEEGKTMDAIVEIFERMNKKGNLNLLGSIFKDLGSDGARLVNVMATMADRADILSKHLRTSRDAFKEGEAVIGEYMIQNQTAAALVERASNLWAKAFVNPEGVDVVKQLAQQWYDLSKSMTQSDAQMASLRISLNGIALVIQTMIKLLPFLIRLMMMVGVAQVIRGLYNGYVQLRMAIDATYVAQGRLNTAMKSNWVLAIVSAIAAALTMLYDYSKAADEAAKREAERQKEFRKSFDKSKEAVEEVTKPLERTKKAIDDLNASQEERDKLLKDALKGDYQDYLDYLGIEIDKTLDLAKAYAMVVKAMKQKKAYEERENFRTEKNGENRMDRIAAQAQVEAAARSAGVEGIDKEFLRKNQHLSTGDLYKLIASQKFGVPAGSRIGQDIFFAQNIKTKEWIDPEKYEKGTGGFTVKKAFNSVELWNALVAYQNAYRAERQLNKEIDDMFNSEYSDIDLEHFDIDDFNDKVEKARWKRKGTLENEKEDKGAHKKHLDKLRSDFKQAKEDVEGVIAKIDEWYNLQAAAIKDAESLGKLDKKEADDLTKMLEITRNEALMRARKAVGSGEQEAIDEWNSWAKEDMPKLMTDASKWSTDLYDDITKVNIQSLYDFLKTFDGSEKMAKLDSKAFLDSILKKGAENKKKSAVLRAQLNERITKLLEQYHYMELAERKAREDMQSIGVFVETYEQQAKRLRENGVREDAMPKPKIQETARKQLVEQFQYQTSNPVQTRQVGVQSTKDLAEWLRHFSTIEKNGQRVRAQWALNMPEIDQWLANAEEYKSDIQRFYEGVMTMNQGFDHQIEELSNKTAKRLASVMKETPVEVSEQVFREIRERFHDLSRQMTQNVDTTSSRQLKRWLESFVSRREVNDKGETVTRRMNFVGNMPQLELWLQDADKYKMEIENFYRTLVDYEKNYEQNLEKSTTKSQERISSLLTRTSTINDETVNRMVNKFRNVQTLNTDKVEKENVESVTRWFKTFTKTVNEEGREVTVDFGMPQIAKWLEDPYQYSDLIYQFYQTLEQYNNEYNDSFTKHIEKSRREIESLVSQSKVITDEVMTKMVKEFKNIEINSKVKVDTSDVKSLQSWLRNFVSNIDFKAPQFEEWLDNVDKYKSKVVDFYQSLSQYEQNYVYGNEEITKKSVERIEKLLDRTHHIDNYESEAILKKFKTSIEKTITSVDDVRTASSSTLSKWLQEFVNKETVTSEGQVVTSRQEWAKDNPTIDLWLSDTKKYEKEIRAFYAALLQIQQGYQDDRKDLAEKGNQELDKLLGRQWTTEDAYSILNKKFRDQGTLPFRINIENEKEAIQWFQDFTHDANGEVENWVRVFPEQSRWVELINKKKDESYQFTASETEEYEKMTTDMQAFYRILITNEDAYYQARKKQREHDKSEAETRWRAAGWTDQQETENRTFDTQSSLRKISGQDETFGQTYGFADEIADDPEIARIKNRMEWRARELEDLQARNASEELIMQKQNEMLKEAAALAEKVSQEVANRISKVQTLSEPLNSFGEEVGQMLGEQWQGISREGKLSFKEMAKNMGIEYAKLTLKMASENLMKKLQQGLFYKQMEMQEMQHQVELTNIQNIGAQARIAGQITTGTALQGIKATQDAAEIGLEGGKATIMTMFGISEGAAKTIGKLGFWGIPLIGVITSILMGLLNSAKATAGQESSSSSSTKDATKIKLVTGMLTYDKGNIDSVSRGSATRKKYLGTDGRIYTATEESEPKDGLVTHPIATTVQGQPALVAEKGPEIVIGRETTANIMRNAPELLQAIVDIDKNPNKKPDALPTYDKGNVGKVVGTDSVVQTDNENKEESLQQMLAQFRKTRSNHEATDKRLRQMDNTESLTRWFRDFATAEMTTQYVTLGEWAKAPESHIGEIKQLYKVLSSHDEQTRRSDQQAIERTMDTINNVKDITSVKAESDNTVVSEEALSKMTAKFRTIEEQRRLDTNDTAAVTRWLNDFVTTTDTSAISRQTSDIKNREVREQFVKSMPAVEQWQTEPEKHVREIIQLYNTLATHDEQMRRSEQEHVERSMATVNDVMSIIGMKTDAASTDRQQSVKITEEIATEMVRKHRQVEEQRRLRDEQERKESVESNIARNSSRTEIQEVRQTLDKGNVEEVTKRRRLDTSNTEEMTRWLNDFVTTDVTSLEDVRSTKEDVTKKSAVSSKKSDIQDTLTVSRQTSDIKNREVRESFTNAMPHVDEWLQEPEKHQQEIAQLYTVLADIDERERISREENSHKKSIKEESTHRLNNSTVLTEQYYKGDDGRIYKAQDAQMPVGVSFLTQPVATMINGKPSLVAERGPEIVIGRRATANIMRWNPALLNVLASYDPHSRRRTYDDGTDIPAAVPSSAPEGQTDPRMADTIAQLSQTVALLSSTVSELQKKGIPATINKYGTGGLIDEVKSGLKFDARYNH